MKLINKIKYNNLLIFCFSIFVLNSCSDDFLEIVPKGRLIAENTEDYDKIFFNTNFVNLRSANVQVLMGDEVAAVNPYFESASDFVQRAFKWEDVLYDADELSNELLMPMEQLYLYNKIINEVPESKGGTEQQKLELQAEALAGRAWTYFLLINYYGLPYNEATSATDLGFPIITEADLVRTDFPRATVKEIYDLIVKDLTTAIPNLPVETGFRIRMCRDAAKITLGKVYLYMHKDAEALPLLNESLANVKSGSLGIDVGLYDYNTGYSSPPVTTENFENIYSKQISNPWVNRANEIVITPETAALYNNNDKRIEFQYAPNTYAGDPYLTPGILKRTIGSFQNTQIGVRTPDLYLLNAEAKCRLNDLPGAVAVLEDFRSYRMPPADAIVPAPIAGNQTALLEFIFEERIREFAVFGERWFDLRRLTVDPLIPVNVESVTHTVYDNSDGSVTNTFQLTKNRLVIRFPETIIVANPDLENND
ncbi:RagB/SusD family nutrient uptake outer membrane protein [Flavivirga sp. 57AJ16]|uniref:RagB/SusD family nutrient uptake outer membrane protein n=1 Tax=Flavivirga sp. 57AJ16 TaxID=3025307 RepID=UPI002364FE7B|nr:RagB/SusD family nutrient uptake outer membrane protein [Flavivirga sp. 57AJ16]MDD7886924.1 RagB/SusD family nutrient uptake outer membrane protein [Flavivirga sp. 57AJ16]